MKVKRIFSLRVANRLVGEGFEIIGHEINSSNPVLKVFLFQDTYELNVAVDVIIGKR